MGWFQRHWPLVGGIILFAHPIWTGLRWILTMAGDIDFLVERWRDPGWIMSAIQFLLSPPPVLYIPMILIGLWLIFWDVRRNRRSATGDDGIARDASAGPHGNIASRDLPKTPNPRTQTGAGNRPPDDSQRRELVASWYRMVDEIDDATSSERGYDRLATIQNELKRRSHYHRLAQYLPEDVQEDVNAPSGIRIFPAITIKGEDTPDQALLKRLRSCIAAIEAEWGLLGPAQPTSSRNSRAPRA